MAVYLLERIAPDPPGYFVGEEAVGYEEAYAAVAVAPDAATARRTVAADTGKDVWLDTKRSRVRAVKLSGPARCVLVASTGA